MQFDSFLNEVCDSFNKNYYCNEKLCSSLIPLKKEVSPNNIEKMVMGIVPEPFSYKIAGVDSGFVSKKLHFMDLILIKLGGVIFSYDKSILKKTEYFPPPVLLPEPILLKTFLEDGDESKSISLERLKKEINLSISLIKKFAPNFLFIDGSIVPQYQDKPKNDSILFKDYKTIINLFQELYSVAKKNNCVLISTIEDSRGQRFKQLLEENFSDKNFSDKFFFNNSTDLLLLDFLLKKQERTFCFSYAKDVLQHPILKDFDKIWSEKIFVFYLKASDFDLPLRVEFILDDFSFKKVDVIASLVFSLSSLHKEYSYPSVLIEADLRARLKEDDISIIYNRLIDKLGNKFRLRRNSRPF